jgi:hypothetical protein
LRRSIRDAPAGIEPAYWPRPRLRPWLRERSWQDVEQLSNALCAMLEIGNSAKRVQSGTKFGVFNDEMDNSGRLRKYLEINLLVYY